MAFKLNGWLKRIRYTGATAPDLKTLRAIVTHQVRAIAFENLDVLLERAIEINDDAIYAKLVEGGRGGYCFELNGLLSCGLRQLGFEVRDLAGRVLVTHSHSLPARTHRMMQVMIANVPWLVDVGFGGMTLTAPMELKAGNMIDTATGRFRLVGIYEDLQLESLSPKGWHPLYRFDLQRQYLSDYQIANEHVALNPASHFRHHLILSLATRDGRLTQLNRRFTRHTLSEEAHHELSDSELYQVINRDFGLHTQAPDHGFSHAELSAALRRVTDARAK